MGYQDDITAALVKAKPVPHEDAPYQPSIDDAGYYPNQALPLSLPYAGHGTGFMSETLGNAAHLARNAVGVDDSAYDAANPRWPDTLAHTAYNTLAGAYNFPHDVAGMVSRSNDDISHGDPYAPRQDENGSWRTGDDLPPVRSMNDKASDAFGIATTLPFFNALIPKGIKSASVNAGDHGAMQPRSPGVYSNPDEAAPLAAMRQSDVSPLGYYSQLDRTLSSLKPTDSVTMQTLGQRGVKASEVEARGINHMFENVAKDGTVTGGSSLGSAGGKLGLDMSHDARMARAKAMGFDPSQTWYHGTSEPNLTEIQPGRSDPGAWFTTDIQNANNYAKGDDSAIHDVYLKIQKPFVVDSLNQNNFIPSHEGKPLNFDNNVDIVNHGFGHGYDSVHFPGGNFTESGDTMVVKNGNQIRSRDAAFNPGQANSTNLLASNPDEAAPLAVLGQPSSNRDAIIRALARTGAPQ